MIDLKNRQIRDFSGGPDPEIWDFYQIFKDFLDFQ